MAKSVIKNTDQHPEKNTKPQLARRQFLVGAGAGVAAAGAALVMSGQVEKAETAVSTDDPSTSKGYKLTEHVKTYYRTLLV